MATADLANLTFWIPTIIAAALVVIAYIDMRSRLRQGDEASKAMISLIKVMREELELFQKQNETGRSTGYNRRLQQA